MLIYRECHCNTGISWRLSVHHKKNCTSIININKWEPNFVLLKNTTVFIFQEVILQAQAQTTKWVTMTLVLSCVGVLGVTGIMMGVYLSGNLGKGDDSDDSVSSFQWYSNCSFICNFSYWMTWITLTQNLI